MRFLLVIVATFLAWLLLRHLGNRVQSPTWLGNAIRHTATATNIVTIGLVVIFVVTVIVRPILPMAPNTATNAERITALEQWKAEHEAAHADTLTRR